MEADVCVYGCALSRVFAYKCAVGRKLMEVFGGVAGVFEAGREALEGVLGHTSEYVDKLCDKVLLDWAADEVAWAGRYGIRLLGFGEADYPRRLAECEDAPLMLYCKGPADLNASRVVAVVGTRKASWYGRETCRRLVGALAELDEKPLIVSGLALGIDGCAHEAALEAGLPTVGVLPCGMDEIYPRQHRELARRMLERGALVTDFARGTAPVAFTFLRRNRIIAGMADATLLAESFAKGGGLITLSLADSYSRETFAVPGRLTDASFEGCNQAIARQEAALVADELTLPVAMGWAAPAGRARRKPLFRPGDPPTRREALKVLESRSPLSADELAAWMRLDAREANLILLELEMEGRVVADGNKFSLSL